MNLTGNALKFTSHGSVTVRVTQDVRTIPKPTRGTALRFEIIDSGIGMSESAQKKLFQPFTQADSSTSRKFGGTGLGLSICKRLVELMGGQIGVFSEEGKGSVFWFEIPTQEVGTETNTVDLPKLDGISVLSVEDHPQGAREIVRSLESMGAKVESVPTYKEGLALARRRPFDVAVIDQGLPDGLGINLIREIMEFRPSTGLIMYTVRDDIGMQHTLNALGVTYLSKPASRVGLGDAVKGAARRNLKLNIDGPTRLLIAEDTASVRDVLQRQLEKLGVDADFVDDGKKALKALESGKYGILFTDLHMPEMDGYDVVEHIRAGEAGRKATRKKGESIPHFPVVVLTADVQMAQRQTYLSHGFDECLLKPVSLGQFRRLLIRWGLLAGAEDEDSTAAESISTTTAPPDNLPPAIDLATMRELMGAVDENAIQMMGMFVDMTAPLIERLRVARDLNDMHELREAGHSLKGAARSASCNVLGDIAAQLQTDAEAHKDGCGALVNKIEAEFERVREAIKNLKPE
jgi:CheY-like chemotaxis protein